MNSESARVSQYCEAWSGSLALLLSQLTANSSTAEMARSELYDDKAFLVCITANRFAGQQWIALRSEHLSSLLTVFLGEETSIAAALDDIQRQATEELCRQWAGLAADALRKDWGEISFQVSVKPEPAVPGLPALEKMIHVSGGQRTIEALLIIDGRLAEALRQTESVGPVSSSAPSSSIQDLLREGNLDLLMDVELAVMLRFGSREATLREVLDMATGAVLELDREIQEPVDLVLNGKVIARGEVVVIDGNYGLRVTEVATPQQRISSL